MKTAHRLGACALLAWTLAASAQPSAAPEIFAPGVVSGPSNDADASFTPGRRAAGVLARRRDHAGRVARPPAGRRRASRRSPAAGWTRSPRWRPTARRWSSSRTGRWPTAMRSIRPATCGASSVMATTGACRSTCPRSSIAAPASGAPASRPTAACISWTGSAATGRSSCGARRPRAAPGWRRCCRRSATRRCSRSTRRWRPTSPSSSSAPSTPTPTSTSASTSRCAPARAGAPAIDLGAPVNLAGNDSNESRLAPDGRTLYFASDRQGPIRYPRTSAQAEADLARIAAWDNGNQNVWRVSLAPWLDAPRKPG